MGVKRTENVWFAWSSFRSATLSDTFRACTRTTPTALTTGWCGASRVRLAWSRSMLPYLSLTKLTDETPSLPSSTIISQISSSSLNSSEEKKKILPTFRRHCIHSKAIFPLILAIIPNARKCRALPLFHEDFQNFRWTSFTFKAKTCRIKRRGTKWRVIITNCIYCQKGYQFLC